MTEQSDINSDTPQSSLAPYKPRALWKAAALCHIASAVGWVGKYLLYLAHGKTTRPFQH